jgi:hypothetical protein
VRDQWLFLPRDRHLHVDTGMAAWRTSIAGLSQPADAPYYNPVNALFRLSKSCR